ncbi:MAG: AraC family transcriptional regulator [Spirochaetaceae bacterium]|nr:AraC family transcriptional regulator [Spirochaetaceae bacterium]
MCEGLRRLYRKAIEGVVSDRKQQDHLNPDDVREHIDRHFRDPISLESVARMFLVSKEHLSRVFRKSFGSTINEYITARRMERARQLISAEDLEIKDAAAMTGYSDLAYFYRVFKKFHGITPGQARGMTKTDQ